MATSRLSLTPRWPMYSARTRGRSDNSNDASSSATEPAITRFDIRLCLRQNLKRSLEQHIERRIAIAIHGPAHCGFGVGTQVAQVLQRRENIGLDRRLRGRRIGEGLQLVSQFQNDALGRFLCPTR